MQDLVASPSYQLQADEELLFGDDLNNMNISNSSSPPQLQCLSDSSAETQGLSTPPHAEFEASVFEQMNDFDWATAFETVGAINVKDPYAGYTPATNNTAPANLGTVI